MLESYYPIFLMLAFAVFFAVLMLKASTWFGPKRPTGEKYTTYESGMEPVGQARDRFSVKFYLVGVLFILFDIELVFLFPYAVNFYKLGLFGFIVVWVFLLIQLIGFVYEWKKGALEWD
jgi:NADH-quinone oxidoreductase subunit A